jgi:G3E family GTPase
VAFLGAGKTTAISRLARRLSAQGQRVGLITNDQGRELVDTAIPRPGFATEEIPGGCFVAVSIRWFRGAQLTAATRGRLYRRTGRQLQTSWPPWLPLRRIYGEDFDIGPYSVLLDPIRAGRVLGLEPGQLFREKILPIYRKQIEEADLLVVNKTDLVTRPT